MKKLLLFFAVSLFSVAGFAQTIEVLKDGAAFSMTSPNGAYLVGNMEDAAAYYNVQTRTIKSLQGEMQDDGGCTAWDINDKGQVFEPIDTPAMNINSSYLEDLFEKAKERHPLSDEMSKKIAHSVLIPAIENADKDTIISAPGTSCREQISHFSSREALHPIVVLYNALKK